MYDELYALGDIGVLALFGGVSVACFALAPFLGQKLGWTVPEKDTDYIIRAQSTLITFTALILAFSLVQAQANHRKTEESVAKEASALNTLDRQLLRYGEQGAALRLALWGYASSIVEDEWPDLRYGRRSPITTAKLTSLTRPVFHLDPPPGRQSTIYAEMIRSIDEISDDREVRISAADLRLPAEFWLMALVLGLILVGLSTAIEAATYHTISIAAQGFALAMLAALVFCSDRPFKGDIAVSPTPIANVLTIMKART